MSTEKEIPFAIFLKTHYEVRPKKNPIHKQTHHWKLRIDGLKSDGDIKRVEFVLHNTFMEPVQVRKKSPFEIEEDGFGNFEIRMNVKILHRIIPMTYFIELFPHKVISTQYHHSLWMVKPKELVKVLDIGGIPMEAYDNNNDEAKALSKIWEHMKRFGDRPVDPGLFYPKVYDRVMRKIKRMEHSESAPIPPMMNTTDMDMGLSDDSSNNRQFHSAKQHRHSKQNSFDPVVKIKSKIPDFEIKKELKRRKEPYDSSSGSDQDISHDALFGKSFKRSDNVPIPVKLGEVKIEKMKRKEFKQESSLPKLPMKPVVKIENKLQKPPKEPKLKVKIKESNPDNFSKLFDGPDLIVLNKGKLNLAKDKSESSSAMVHDSAKRKAIPKEMASDHMTDEARFQKKAVKIENRLPTKESRHGIKSSKVPDNSSMKPLIPDVKKIKPPEKTMPPDQRKEKKSEFKTKKLSSSFYQKPLSSLSRSDSELGSISGKSSPDNEVDPQLFAPKKKKSPIDQSKVVVKQLFGDDDNDNSDDEDQPGDLADLFSVLKNSGTKPPAVPVTKRHKEPSLKSDEDVSSENEAPSRRPGNVSLQQSPDPKSHDREVPIKERCSNGTEVHNDQLIPMKERRKLAKMLLKIKNKRFFAKLQRLLLNSFENREKSVSFDMVTMRLDFHMGEVSDELVKTIRAMVEEYIKEHGRTLSNMTNNRGF